LAAISNHFIYTNFGVYGRSLPDIFPYSTERIGNDIPVAINIWRYFCPFKIDISSKLFLGICPSQSISVLSFFQGIERIQMLSTRSFVGMTSGDSHLNQLEIENDRGRESKERRDDESNYSRYLAAGAAFIIGLLLYYVSFKLTCKAVEWSSYKSIVFLYGS